ncbi:MAG: reverse transcriptase family protein, partial [Pseudomonadota bacterium]
DDHFLKTVSSHSELGAQYLDTLSSLFDKHIPVVRRFCKERPPVPWFNRLITSAIRERRKLERNWRVSHLEMDRRLFVVQRNKVQRLIRHAKSEYYEHFVSNCSSDTKSLWNVIRSSLCQNKIPVYPTFDLNCEGPSKFADFFEKKISLINESLNPSCSNCDDTDGDIFDESFTTFSAVSVDEAEGIIRSMKATSCALDPAPSWLVKLLVSDLSKIFCLFANLSLQCGVFPSYEKRAIVKPLLKKAGLCKEELSNYRPVSHLSFLSKFVERVVAKQLNCFLNSHNLFPMFQSAYRRGHSCESVLLHFLNEIILAKANKFSSCTVFLDMSAAFDTVNHSSLFNRLSVKYGLSGVVFEWFRSYLCDRLQSICLNDCMSDWRSVNQGVPQGSVLGPILFSLYSSPLSSIIQSYGLSCHVYADDIAIFTSFTLHDRIPALNTINDCTFHVFDWLNSNSLRVNPNKSKVLFCPSVGDALDNILVGDVNIEVSSSCKYLGVTLDEGLCFSEHISRVCRYSFAFIRSLWRIRRYLNEHSASLIIHSYISSQLDYCNGIFSLCPLYRLRPLQRVQNACVRALKFLPRTVHITPFLRELHWLPTRLRIEFKICCIVHKCVYGPSPTYLRSSPTAAPR